MSYIFSDLGDKDRIQCLEKEIVRLQEMCRKNFGIIDELRKENRKLSEVQEELKETTGDLGYSMAECPWWEDEEVSQREAVKILASFTQKVQYILGLPTFINPFEQMEKSECTPSQMKRIMMRRKLGRKFIRTPLTKCVKCKRTYRSQQKLQSHSKIHKASSKSFKCKFCAETFQIFPKLKSHYKEVHGQETPSQRNLQVEFSSSFNYFIKSRRHFQNKRHFDSTFKCQRCTRYRKYFLISRKKEEEPFKNFVFNPKSNEKISNQVFSNGFDSSKMAKIKWAEDSTEIKNGELQLHINGMEPPKSVC